jgi:hypothetical protein
MDHWHSWIIDMHGYIDKQRQTAVYLLENLKGERTPEVSLAAHPKAFFGCSCSGDFAISETLPTN